MIGKISGLIEEKSTHSVLVNVNGLCYEIEVPITTAFSLPEVGTKVSLFTHFVVREDAQLLYGFLNRNDRDMFRILIKVNGVGPKLGITILSGLDSIALARCVIHDEVNTLVKLPGIGKKTAERLLIELRDKVKSLESEKDSESALLTNSPTGSSILEEAESALVALGYKPQDAARAIKNSKAENQSLEALIKAALKSMI